MKKIFLYAYDKVNLGDDLFIKFIVKRYPNVLFYLWSDAENKKNFKNLSNLIIINKDSKIFCLIKKIKPSLLARYKTYLENRCTASVYIGGSILMEYEKWKNQIEWFRYQIKNNAFFIVGANFGPYKTEAYKEAINEIFYGMKDVCVRDTYSKKVFEKNEIVRYAPDILFAYPLPKVKMKKKTIFVSVINCMDRDAEYSLEEFEENYVNNMARILNSYLDDDYEIILAAFCKAEGDDLAMRKILTKMGDLEDTKVKMISYDGTNEETILCMIAEAEYIIASRFHAVVLGMVAEKPILPIVYSDKTLRVLEDLEFKGTVFDLRDKHIWDYKLSRKNLENPLQLLPEEIKRKSKKHFEKLDEMFCK